MLKVIWLYFIRHKSRVTSLICLVSLGVVGLGILSSLFFSFGATRERMISGTNHWVEAVIMPGDKDPKLLEAAILSAVNEIAGVTKVIETDIAYLSYNLFGAATGHMPVYGVNEVDLTFFLDKAGLIIKEGQNNLSSSQQILVAESFLKANRLNVGDIYKETTPVSTNGVYHISAALSGDLILGIGKQGISTPNSVKGFLIFAPKELLSTVEKEMTQKLAKHRFSILINGPQKTKASIKTNYGSYYGGVWGITVVISLIFALGLSLFNASDIKSRQKEFGIMQITGWRNSTQYLIALFEIAAPVLVGWVLGVLLLSIVVMILQTKLFAPHGLFINRHNSLILLTLLLPGMVILSSLFLLKKILKRDVVSILQESLEKDKTKNKHLWRQLDINFLRYPLRTGAYKAEVIGLTCFVATIIFFGFLTGSLTKGISDSGEIFKTLTLIELNTPLPASNLDLVSDIQGVKASAVVTFARVSEKLILGERSIYAIALLEDDVKTFFPDISQSKGLVLSSSIAKRMKTKSNRLLSLGKTDCVVEASGQIPGSAMLLLGDSLAENAILVLLDEKARDKANQRLREFFFANPYVEAIIDYTSISRELTNSTQFIKFLIEVITWLQFFVILVIVAFSIWRTTISRQKELAIKTLIGIDEKKVLKDTLLERLGTVVGALLFGFASGLLLWFIFSQLIFQDIYVSFALDLKSIRNSFLLSALILMITAFVIKRTMSSKDLLLFVK